MPVIFLDNYPNNNLKSTIIKKDGSPLEGEIWVYSQFLQFNENNVLPEDTWYLKHNYNLSIHPASKGKIEGQIDFLLLTKHGLLIIEVKGGGLRVDERDCYYSYNKSGQFETQNPFIQAKEYVHTLKNLNDNSNLFVYRAVVLPHEGGFELKSPQLSGYKNIFFSKRNFFNLNSDVAINNCFFDFVKTLATKAKRHNLTQLNPLWSLEKVNKKLGEFYPPLSIKDLRRIKSELFPVQTSYGYNPERINSEIILKENYEILKGLRRNQKVMVQGAPGTGKTVLAQKFIAENLLKQHKGIIFFGNKLIRSKFEHIMIGEYQLDPSSIKFRIYSDKVETGSVGSEIDFLVFDEAQEYFDKGLFDFIDELDKKLEKPRVLVLYDPEQSLISEFKEMAWYTDFFIESAFTHYYFDEVFRGTQNTEIIAICQLIKNDQVECIERQYNHCFKKCVEIADKLRLLKSIIDEKRFHSKEKVILLQSDILENFKKIASDYFQDYFEELTEININIPSQKIKYTTPLKYRGLENKSVYLIVGDINESNKTQLYVGATRSMELLKIVLWL